MRGRSSAAARASVVALLAAVFAIVAIVAATAAVAEPASSAQAPSSKPAPARSTAALGDPLESAECRRMLAALDAEEAAVAESARAGGAVSADERRLIDARLASARRGAARSCLARRADPPTLSAGRPTRPPPITTPPLAVAPPPLTTPPLAVAPASNPAPATARAAPLASPNAARERPYAITSCDPGGCWANDGSRLNRVGPNLWGARGICTVQGSLVQCP